MGAQVGSFYRRDRGGIGCENCHTAELWYNGPDNFLPEPKVEDLAIACRFGQWRLAWAIFG
jgi:hypothetical protein